MDTFISVEESNNAQALTRSVGLRLKAMRLSKGWTQQELSRRANIALSTLKLMEATGKGSFQRLVRVACILGAEHEISNLFLSTSYPGPIDDLERGEHRRAPRRKPD